MPSTIKISSQWKRPQNVPFPQIWRRFEVKLPNGNLCKIRIQDLTPDRFEEAWQFCVKYFWAEEPAAKALRFIEDQNTMKNLKQLHFKIMNQNLTLVALKDEPDNPKSQMISVFVSLVHTRKEENIIELEGEKTEKYERLENALKKDINIFDRYDVDVYLEDCGVSVLPEFHGQHIATNMILTITDVAKAFGIGAKVCTLVNFKLASVTEKEQYEVLREIFYDDFRDENDDIIVPVKEYKSICYCGLKFN